MIQVQKVKWCLKQTSVKSLPSNTYLVGTTGQALDFEISNGHELFYVHANRLEKFLVLPYSGLIQMRYFLKKKKSNTGEDWTKFYVLHEIGNTKVIFIMSFCFVLINLFAVKIVFTQWFVWCWIGLRNICQTNSHTFQMITLPFQQNFLLWSAGNLFLVTGKKSN